MPNWSTPARRSTDSVFCCRPIKRTKAGIPLECRPFCGKEPERVEKICAKAESLSVAVLLAVAGGLLDAYTYLCRGAVFANAQTGNLVLLAVRLADGDWRSALRYLAPVAAFVLGVWLAEWLRRANCAGGRFRWQNAVLLIEMGVLCLVAFVPAGTWNSAVNLLVSFVCALQVEAFRKVRGNPFASTMCTGNLRSGTEALFHGIQAGEKTQLRKSGYYFVVIASFLLGAALGGFLSRPLGQWTVLGAVAPQALVFLLLLRRET